MKTILLAFLFTLNLFANDVLNKKMFQNGEEIYYETCVSCHGESGETNPEIKLVVKPRKLNSTILTQEQSLLVIKEGAHHWGAHADIMPAFKYVYTQEQMLSVAY